MQRTLRLERTALIQRPIGLVRRQFADIAHHATAAPHRGVRFDVISDDGERCRYRQTTAVGPLRLRQELELIRSADGPLVNRVIAGSLAGGEIRFDFHSSIEGADATHVTATVCAELSGLEARIHRILERRIARTLDRALDEDRDDLESDNYAGALSSSNPNLAR